ncbi:hypothetical protein [Sphingomonas mesophila]|uniref:hypothetical protein n=1 Tax=Sphingomonas mesophila TaxID=2303576 RepID=UPI0013C2A06E|nr:hypothetical protein [Sphingomonas mesophila]
MAVGRFRPREGWRVFAGEVGVIVLGVLIALVAQQAAENWQWSQTVERTKADLNAQISLAVASSAERTAVDACLSQRLSELAGKVAASRGDWTGDPYILPGERSVKEAVRYAVPRVYRTPQRFYSDDAWQQSKAGGVLTRMDPAEMVQYAEVFAHIAMLQSLKAPEQELQAELSFLAFDGPLNSTERARALSTIARLDVINRDTLNTANQLVKSAQAVGSSLTPVAEKLLFNNLDIQRRLRGRCVDRAATLRLIAPLQGGGR